VKILSKIEIDANSSHSENIKLKSVIFLVIFN